MAAIKAHSLADSNDIGSHRPLFAPCLRKR
jgi:hypothetical protein